MGRLVRASHHQCRHIRFGIERFLCHACVYLLVCLTYPPFFVPGGSKRRNSRRRQREKKALNNKKQQDVGAASIPVDHVKAASERAAASEGLEWQVAQDPDTGYVPHP